MIKYAGQNLLLPDEGGELQAWLDRYCSLADIVPALVSPSLKDGRTRPQGSWPHAVGLPTLNWSQQPPEWKLNSLWWPTGASRHAIGLFLADHATVQLINAQLSDDGSATLEISDGTTTISPTMYLLPPRPLAPVMAGANPPCLLVLVDKRYFWQWSKLGAVAYGPTTTWADVLGDINSALGISASASVSADYLNPDWSEWVRQYENAAVALDAWAASTGHRFTAAPDGTYSLQGFSAAEAAVAANLASVQLVAGNAHVITAATAPGTLTVAFAKRQGGVPHQRGDCYQVTKQASDYGWADAAPGAAVIHSTCQADFSSRSSDPDNAIQLSALAARIATDFYGWKRKQYSATAPGVVHWQVNGFDDFLWLHVGHQPQADSACPCEGEESPYTFHTRIESLPPSFGFEEQLSQRSDTKTFRPMPIFRAQLTADFQENSDGIYQATAQLLYDATSGTGSMSLAGTDVTVFDTLSRRGSAGAGSNIWVSALAADSNMFEVITGDSDGLIRFELYGGGLDLAGEQTAKVCRLNAGDWQATDTVITIVDPYDDPGCWMGYEGYQGFCVKRTPDASTGVWDGKYEVVWMERPALTIEGTALADRGDTDYFDVKLDRYYQQGNKLPPGAESDGDGGYTVRVYDVHVENEAGELVRRFPRVLKGCKGMAIWDDVNKVYRAMHWQQRALKLKATANGDNCGTSTMAVSNVKSMYPSPIGTLPDPVPTSFLNDSPGPVLQVQDGDWVEADWDDDVGDYVVTEVKHKSQDVITARRFNNGCWEYKKRKIAVSSCEDESDWIQEICGDPCE